VIEIAVPPHGAPDGPTRFAACRRARPATKRTREKQQAQQPPQHLTLSIFLGVVRCSFKCRRSASHVQRGLSQPVRAIQLNAIKASFGPAAISASCNALSSKVARPLRPTAEMRSTSTRKAILTGVFSGLVAGVPQVLLTQLEAWLLPTTSRESADIGPRFVQTLGHRFGADLEREHHWLLAGAFHFGYAAWWGGMYAALQRWRRAQPHVGGPLLASLIYLLAFSPWGAATQTGTEQPVRHRPTRETLLHWTAALSFSLSLAYLYDRLQPDDSDWAALTSRLQLQ
jgi:hypothetical protein